MSAGLTLRFAAFAGFAAPADLAGLAAFAAGFAAFADLPAFADAVDLEGFADLEFLGMQRDIRRIFLRVSRGQEGTFAGKCMIFPSQSDGTAVFNRVSGAREHGELASNS
jgi:hypothetical protein